MPHQYSAAEVLAYYHHLSLPEIHRHEPGESSTRVAESPAEGLKFLTALQQHQLCAIPWENLDLHYKPEHMINIDPQHVYEKIVQRNEGHGGYCMEVATLFGGMLKSLGFRVYSGGAKVNRAIEPGGGQGFVGWSHHINIVLFGDRKYVVDVGAGGFTPTCPLELADSSSNPIRNVGSQHVRLVRGTIDEKRTGPPYWRVEMNDNPETSSWYPVYAFTEIEFTHEDFETMNYMTARNSWFKDTIVCCKHVMGSDGKVNGTMTMSGQSVKSCRGLEKEVLAICQSEDERVKLLLEVFGIQLSEEEKQAITVSTAGIKG